MADDKTAHSTSSSASKAPEKSEKPDESTSLAGSSSGSGSAYPPPEAKPVKVPAGSKGPASSTSDVVAQTLLAEVETAKLNNDKDALKAANEKLTDLGYEV